MKKLLLIIILMFVCFNCAKTDKPKREEVVSPTMQQSQTQQATPEVSMPTTNANAPVVTKTAVNDIAEYRKLVRSIDSKGDIVKELNEGLTPDQVKITITNSWHYEPYQVRLQVAQKLWEAWARLHSPNEPDKARIKIVDLNGNEVGGSRVWAGSLIWVQED